MLNIENYVPMGTDNCITANYVVPLQRNNLQPVFVLN